MRSINCKIKFRNTCFWTINRKNKFHQIYNEVSLMKKRNSRRIIMDQGTFS